MVQEDSEGFFEYGYDADGRWARIPAQYLPTNSIEGYNLQGGWQRRDLEWTDGELWITILGKSADRGGGWYILRKYSRDVFSCTHYKTKREALADF